MLESSNHVNHPMLGNRVLMETLRHEGEWKLLETMKTCYALIGSTMNMIEFI
jgi:hypothetical protein